MTPGARTMQPLRNPPMGKPENLVTLADCAKCPIVSICDAHITGGEWKHRAGVNPCKVSYD